MSNDIIMHNVSDHNHDDNYTHVNKNKDDDDIDIDEYDLQSATDRLFEIVNLGEDVSRRDEELAIRLLQQFPNAAQSVQ